MLRTLYARLAIVLALLLISIGVTYTLVSASAMRHYQREVDQQFNRELAHNLVADRNLVEEDRINEKRLKETFHMYMQINPSIEIYLLDNDGNILSYSAEPDKVKRKRVSLTPINRFLQNEGSLVMGDDPRSLDRKKVFSVTPVPSVENMQGYLYVVLQGEEYEQINQAIRENYLLRQSSWLMAGSLLFGLLAGLLVFRVLTRRLHRLGHLMEDFRISNLSSYTPYVEPAMNDEIDRLGATFNHMAERIITQLGDLKKKDSQRRELVAQVSHDLRTPLASLHGYIETLQLKDKTLTETERNEYLDIALRHSERLSRLVQSLFELARLDATDTPPRYESFGPAELVQDVVQKFKLQAQQRQIDLDMEIDGDIPFVSAEISLIERVLENLIENALNHTPAGGQVRVRVQGEQGGAIINVTDTGCGIAEKELPRIFDRLYQVGNQHRGSDHAGLGLAIAKRVLELHGRDIQVTSQQSKGTTFTFTLPGIDQTINTSRG